MGQKYTPRYADASKRPRRYRNLWLILTVLLALVLLVSGVIAKYVQQRESKGAVVAKEFYFTSDLLTEEGSFHTLNMGTESFSFTLRNSGDDLRKSEVDIPYKIEITNGAALSSNEGILAKAETEETVTVSGLENGKSYTVTVSTTGGYGKILKGTFTVRDETGLYQTLQNMGSYRLLTVWSEGYAGEVKIEYGNTCIPDNTNPNMQTWKSDDNSQTVHITANQSYEFRFFGSGEIAAKDKDGNPVPTP